MHGILYESAARELFIRSVQVVVYALWTILQLSHGSIRHNEDAARWGMWCDSRLSELLVFPLLSNAGRNGMCQGSTDCWKGIYIITVGVGWNCSSADSLIATESLNMNCQMKCFPRPASFLQILRRSSGISSSFLSKFCGFHTMVTRWRGQSQPDTSVIFRPSNTRKRSKTCS